MTIGELLQQSKHPDTLGVELLLAHVLGVQREYLFAHPEQEVEQKLEQDFRNLYERLLNGEPVAHLTGVKEFYGLEFDVNASVLIPRPETEMLVEKVIAFVGDQQLRILDIGTGSGAIAVSLAKHLPHAVVMGTDVSGEAVQVAQMNARKHNVGVDFVVADLLEGVSGPFDIIVANLPYIGEERYRFVSRETEQYEPSIALFGGSDGLELYRRLFQQLSGQNWKPRLLLGEFGFAQGEVMRELLDNFFEQEDWHIAEDYASIERIFVVPFTSHD